MWDNISFLFLVLLKGNLNYGTIPRGDRGTLCPSYDLSFSVFLLNILLFREKDTLSIAVPKRIANCWLGFGFSSCKQTCRDGTPARCYFIFFLLLREHAALSIMQNKGKNKSPGSDCCFGPPCWQFGAGCFPTVDFWHCWAPPGPPAAQAEARSQFQAQTSADGRHFQMLSAPRHCCNCKFILLKLCYLKAIQKMLVAEVNVPIYI